MATYWILATDHRSSCVSLYVQRAVVKVQQCEVGAALLTLPLDFSAICQGLRKVDRGLASLGTLVQVRDFPFWNNEHWGSRSVLQRNYSSHRFSSFPL